jgi:hypothetical protein
MDDGGRQAGASEFDSSVEAGKANDARLERVGRRRRVRDIWRSRARGLYARSHGGERVYLMNFAEEPCGAMMSLIAGRTGVCLSDSRVTQLLCNPSSREPVRVVLLKFNIYFVVEIVNDNFSLLLVC